MRTMQANKDLSSRRAVSEVFSDITVFICLVEIKASGRAALLSLLIVVSPRLTKLIEVFDGDALATELGCSAFTTSP